jgi:hypothetical protein
MKLLLIVILVFMFSTSCATYKQNIIDSNLMNTSGEVIYVCTELNYYTVRFYCVNPPYKLQPCWKDVHFKLDNTYVYLQQIKTIN